jgi:hypothetical protein
MSAPRYEVSVWDNVNGDVVKYVRECDEDELSELEDWYNDDGIHQVVIDREWEEEDEE